MIEGSAGTTVTVETANHSPKLVAHMEAFGDYFNAQMGSAGHNYSFEEVFGHKQPTKEKK